MRKFLFSLIFFCASYNCFSQSVDFGISSIIEPSGAPYKFMYEFGSSFRYNHVSAGLIYTLTHEEKDWRINMFGFKSKIFFLNQSKQFNVFFENSSSFQLNASKENIWLVDYNDNINKNPWFGSPNQDRKLKKINYFGYFGAGGSVTIANNFYLSLSIGVLRYNWTFTRPMDYADQDKEYTNSFWRLSGDINLTYSIPVAKKDN